MTLRRAVLAVALTGMVLGAGAASARAATDGFVARYDFDGGRSGAIADESGNGHVLGQVSSGGGAVRVVAHRSGQALRFPARCGRKDQGTCPHIALQSPSTASLNPGTRPLSFGASVLLAKSQTTKGQNIVQKGYSATSSQWKMQIDGEAGQPSCVLVGARPGIKMVRSSVSVTDGHWHTLRCLRRGTQFTIVVDGVVRGTRTISAELAITNELPLSIGGKGAFRDNDQFQGILDDVWVRVG
ncbi:LamG-like jellyroll fold domain-containing protein [Winogradskya humida]|uniref:Concanavalin A-like lectin/glucanase superfamily protein n=1 Tax=Winogradskya humida TaxID=113566 RepID=A0ABQ3ZMS2_9ACTN|nr:LamG-like jellyroll fold domain-containing protein [Actinoplanes humidus]GIE19879.1 hypothetical protein Ahu01nite_029810 [Actinoplanes humidus]